MYDEESQYSQIEIDRKKFIEGINVLNAYYISPQNRTSFVVEFSHPDEENSLIKEIVRTDIESDMLKRVLGVYSYEEILNNTHARMQIASNFMKNLDDFIKGREKEDEESKEEQSTVVSLDYLKTMPTQDLFKLKLEIFEVGFSTPNCVNSVSKPIENILTKNTVYDPSVFSSLCVK